MREEGREEGRGGRRGAFVLRKSMGRGGGGRESVCSG